METDEIKSLKRQRSFLIVIVALLAFVTLVSIVYAYTLQGTARDNAQRAQAYAEKADLQARITNAEKEKARLAELKAKQQAQLAELARRDAEEYRIKAEITETALRTKKNK